MLVLLRGESTPITIALLLPCLAVMTVLWMLPSFLNCWKFKILVGEDGKPEVSGTWLVDVDLWGVRWTGFVSPVRNCDRLTPTKRIKVVSKGPSPREG
jgi:hypothetical protein